MEILFKSEMGELVAVAAEYQRQYNELLSSFNLNALHNYELLEQRYQGKTKL
jgi:hypothetical protein